jgi:hypothetical protein
VTNPFRFFFFFKNGYWHVLTQNYWISQKKYLIMCSVVWIMVSPPKFTLTLNSQSNSITRYNFWEMQLFLMRLAPCERAEGWRPRPLLLCEDALSLLQMVQQQATILVLTKHQMPLSWSWTSQNCENKISVLYKLPSFRYFVTATQNRLKQCICMGHILGTGFICVIH